MTTGFKASSSDADVFSYPSPVKDWKPTETSAVAQTVDLGEAPAGGPSQMKMDLRSPGFMLYFPNGIDLRLSSTGAPFLSWGEGSVGETVPTPAGPWVLVSFRTDQPPVLLSFVDAQPSVQIDGESGNWHLRSQAPYKGWVRFLLPLGETPANPVTASGLGQLARAVTENQALWTGPPPALTDTHIDTDGTSITVTWTFDKAGALVPGAALLAGYGGDSLQITSQIMQLEGSDEDGPFAVAKEPKLSIRFLMRPWPPCRYLALGDAEFGSAQGVLDPGGASTLAFEVLSSTAGPKLLADSGSELMAYLASSKGAAEPYTNLRLPYLADGTGYDVAAAHALLTQALSTSNGTPDLTNPLLSEVLARLDAYSWRPWNMDETRARRAGSLAAIALAMRPEPDQRLIGAMAQAGLSAQRGLDLWRHWKGVQAKLPEHLESMEDLRRRIFSLKGVSTKDPLTELLFSPVRSCGLIPLHASNVRGKTILSWMSLDGSPGVLVLSSEQTLTFKDAQNLQGMKVEHAGSTWTVHFTPTAAGACGLAMSLPPGAGILPPAVVPQYVEAAR